MTYRQWRDAEIRRIADDAHLPVAAVARLYAGFENCHTAPLSVFAYLRATCRPTGVPFAALRSACRVARWNAAQAEHNVRSCLGLEVEDGAISRLYATL